VTPTVQVAPGARFTPVQLSAPLVQAQIKPAPETATLVTATCELPAAEGLVKVMVPLPDNVPVGRVTVSGLGEMETVARAATPDPVSDTGVGVTVAPV
jgi:hypothetical protein